MDFNGIVNFVCAKVSKTDAYSQARCMDFTKARHKLIFESYDWKIAQILVEKTLAAGGGTIEHVDMPEVHHVLSVRLDNTTLDPVSPSFIFDNSTGADDQYAGIGTPRHYDELNDTTTGTRRIKFFPQLADDGVNSHALVVLGKTPYDDTWTAPVVPQSENALIAFVTGDMWEYLHQVGKAQSKFQEATALLQAAQQADTPPAMRSRTTRRLTATGNSLSELVDSVCDIISDFTPQTRNSVKSRVRRNYQTVWNYALWPETVVMATVTAEGGTAIITHLIDKIISVRVNVDVSVGNYQKLAYEESSLLLGIRPGIFEQTGSPLSYNLLLPVALPNSLDAGSQLQVFFTGTDTGTVFLKGEASGVEVFESIAATNVAATTTNSFDDVLTIHKPVSKSSLRVTDVSNNVLMELGPGEEERKYPRINIFPAFDDMADQSVFVLGKRRLPQLMEDGDTCQLSGAENILINASAADMLLKTGKGDVAATLKASADAALQALADRETKQATTRQRVLPSVEPLPLSFQRDPFFSKG